MLLPSDEYIATRAGKFIALTKKESSAVNKKWT